MQPDQLMSLLGLLQAGRGRPCCGDDANLASSEKNQSGTQIRITTGLAGSVTDGIAQNARRTISLDLGQLTLGPEAVDRMLHDLDGVREVVTKHPRKFEELVCRLQQGDVDQAVNIAQGIGLTEEALQARGGGLSFLVVFVAAVVIVLVTPRPISVHSETPPQQCEPLEKDEDEVRQVDSYLGLGD